MASLSYAKIREKTVKCLYWDLRWLKEDERFADIIQIGSEKEFIRRYSQMLTTFIPAFQVIPHPEIKESCILTIRVNQKCHKDWLRASLSEYLDWLKDGFQGRGSQTPFKYIGKQLYFCFELSGYQLFKKREIILDKPVVQNVIQSEDGPLSVLLIDLNWSKKKILLAVDNLTAKAEERYEVDKYPLYLKVYRMRKAKMPFKLIGMKRCPSLPESKATSRVEKQYKKAEELVKTAQIRIVGKLIGCKDCPDRGTDKCKVNCPILKKQLKRVEVGRRHSLFHTTEEQDYLLYGGKTFTRKR